MGKRQLFQAVSEAAAIATGKAGGRPLYSLPNDVRRRLTSGASPARSKGQPHQGGKEMERRRKQMQRAGGKGE